MASPDSESDFNSGETESGKADEAQDIVEQASEYLDALQRLQAEFENYRKRVSRDSSQLGTRVKEEFVSRLLPVLDTIDLALDHEPSGSLEQVRAALQDVLAKESLERIDQVGVSFDPAVHDAVEHEDGDNPPEVVEVMRAGYRLGERVLRPAMVKVKGS